MCNDVYVPLLLAKAGRTETPMAPEVDLARQLQQLLFPETSPHNSWCRIGARNRMADGLGGDYFDFVTLSNNRQALLIGDVTGHGMHASIVMSFIYGFIHHATQGECAPLDVVRQVNRFLVMLGQRSRLLDHFFSSTLFFGIIDPETLSFNYVNAGHASPLLDRGGKIFELDATGQPIGFFEEPELEIASFQFEKGDRLLLYTDGIVEATSPAGDLFGSIRLKETLLSHRGNHLELLDLIFDKVVTFEAGAPPKDDCTAIVLDLLPRRIPLQL